jgi:hypothetical protein
VIHPGRKTHKKQRTDRGRARIFSVVDREILGILRFLTESPVDWETVGSQDGAVLHTHRKNLWSSRTSTSSVLWSHQEHGKAGEKGVGAARSGFPVSLWHRRGAFLLSSAPAAALKSQ